MKLSPSVGLKGSYLKYLFHDVFIVMQLRKGVDADGGGNCGVCGVVLVS